MNWRFDFTQIRYDVIYNMFFKILSGTQQLMNNQKSVLRKGLLLSVLAASLLTACSSGKWGFPYRAPVQQGNWITAEQVSLLRPGMTADQVRYALGSPTLTNVFHPNRWDYSYYFKPGYGEPVLRKFAVWFDDKGLLSHWEGDAQPNFQPSDYETQQQWTPQVDAEKAKEAAKAEQEASSVEASDSGVTTRPLK